MNLEKKTNGVEVPSRVELDDALRQYPESSLLQQVDRLSKSAYTALYNEYNKNRLTFNDFALFEIDNGTGNISSLLDQLELAEDEATQQKLAKQISGALVP